MGALICEACWKEVVSCFGVVWENSEKTLNSFMGSHVKTGGGKNLGSQSLVMES